MERSQLGHIEKGMTKKVDVKGEGKNIELAIFEGKLL